MGPDRILTRIDDVYLVDELLFLHKGLVLAKLLDEIISIFVGHKDPDAPQYLRLHNGHDLRVPVLLQDVLHQLTPLGRAQQVEELLWRHAAEDLRQIGLLVNQHSVYFLNLLDHFIFVIRQIEDAQICLRLFFGTYFNLLRKRLHQVRLLVFLPVIRKRVVQSVLDRRQLVLVDPLAFAELLHLDLFAQFGNGAQTPAREHFVRIAVHEAQKLLFNLPDLLGQFLTGREGARESLFAVLLE